MRFQIRSIVWGEPNHGENTPIHGPVLQNHRQSFFNFALAAIWKKMAAERYAHSGNAASDFLNWSWWLVQGFGAFPAYARLFQFLCAIVSFSA